MGRLSAIGMDLTQESAARAQASIKEASFKVIDLSSSAESEIGEALAGVPRVTRNGVNGVDGSDVESGDDANSQSGSGGSGDDDDDNEDWEIESIFEDTLGEMDDQQLFESGEWALS